MAQLSIFEKQRHHSTKDFTCSVGKYDIIYISFRNNSWKRFTTSNKISVEIKNNILVFGDPEEHPDARSYKLRRTCGDIETTEHTRYLQISGKAWPAFLEAARNMSGSYNFDEAADKTPKQIFDDETAQELLKDYLAKTQIITDLKATPTPEQIEAFKKAWEQCNEPAKLDTLALADPIPKGFVILRDVEGIPFMIPIKSIIYVSPYCEDRELTNIEYITEDNKRYCPVSCDSFAVVVDLIRKALEV